MLRIIVDIGVPILVFAAMVVVGMELTAEDFRRIARLPRIVAAATLSQVVLLPFLGWFLARNLSLKPAIAQGMLLLAACPSGAMANIYTYVARANVALSVTLTAVSCLLAVLTTPLTFAVLQMHAEASSGFSLPVRTLGAQLLLVLVLPVLCGMWIRHRWPEVTKKNGRLLLGCNVSALLLLLGFIISREPQQFTDAFREIAVAAGALTILAFCAGWVTAWAATGRRADRFTVAMVFVVRNVGVATAIAVTFLGRIDFAVFGTAYFLAQVPVLLAASLLFRYLQMRSGDQLIGADTP